VTPPDHDGRQAPARPLPTLRPLSRTQLAWFDLRHSLPATWGALRRHMGRLAAASLLLRALWAARRDPLRGLPRASPPWPKEALARQQLRGAFLLDDALRARAPRTEPADRLAILRDVIVAAGVRFLRHTLPFDDPTAWRAASQDERARFVRQAFDRFPNAQARLVATGADHAAFDVTACRFVDLCRAAGRDHLAPLFCAADAAYFGRDGRPSLERPHTLAQGDPVCAFRLSLASRPPHTSSPPVS